MITTHMDHDVTAAQRGDREAYGRLVDRTRGLVTSLCFSELHDPAAAQDLAQDVYLAAWQGLSQLREPSSFVPWLRQLARNRARDARDAGRRRPVPTEDQVLAATTDLKPGPVDVLLSSEERAIVEEAMSALAADDREVLILYYREGQSIGQVAVLLDLAEDAAKKRLSRARSRLRADIVDRFGEVASRTAPPDGFRAGVLAALPVTASLSGAVATVKAAAKVAAGAGAILGDAATGVGAAGLAFGAGAVVTSLAYNKMSADAVDDTDRKELRSIRNAIIVLCAVFTVGTLAAALSGAGRAVAYTMMAILYVGIMYLAGPRQHRLLRRRAELTAARDPNAWAKYRRALGFSALGAALGTASMVWCVMFVWRVVPHWW